MSEELSGMGSEKRTRSKKEPIAVKYINLTLSLNADPVSTLPDFPVRFHVAQPSPGRFLVLREREERQVILSNKEDVIAEVLKFVQTGPLSGLSEWNTWSSCPLARSY